MQGRKHEQTQFSFGTDAALITICAVCFLDDRAKQVERSIGPGNWALWNLEVCVIQAHMAQGHWSLIALAMSAISEDFIKLRDFVALKKELYKYVEPINSSMTYVMGMFNEYHNLLGDDGCERPGPGTLP